MKGLLIQLPNYFVAAILVILGQYGNGEDRKNKLEKAGYDYAKVQKIVNQLLPIIKEAENA